MKQENVLKLWENVFTSLHAGWYNWAISSSLREINNYPWSTITAFYSIHSLAQVLVYLAKELDREEENPFDFVAEQEKLSEFFLNLNLSKEYREIRYLFLTRLIKKTGLSLDLLDKKIKILGDLLRIDKNYRFLKENSEKKLYDEFWITTNARFLGNILKANLIVTEIIRFNIENCQPPERYLILLYLQEELKNLHKILKKEKIEQISSWDFNDFLEEFSQFIHSELVFLKEIELPLISEQEKKLLEARKTREEWKKKQNNDLKLIKQWSFI